MEPTTTISLGAVAKNLSYVAVFLASTTYLEITPVSVEVLAFLVVVDMITGILKSGTVNGWASIRSSIMERGLIAKLLILLIPIILALCGKGVGIPLGFLAQATLNTLIFSEAYSVMGNIYSIRTGIIQDEFDGVAYVLKGLKNILKKIILEDPQKDPQ